jgi:ABC-type glycerol-3-phosphate transport system substrate-binding protein
MSPHRHADRSDVRSYAPTRRQLLSLMALGGSVAVGGGLLSACSRRGEGSAAEVVLTTVDGWPYGPMPSAKEQQDDPNKRAYAEAFQVWLKDHPGVRIKNGTVDIWSQQALVTAISGGTAPAMFQGDLVGNWNRAGTKSAMVRGLLADVTEQLEAYELSSKLMDFAAPIWEKWSVGGGYYAAPQSYSCGNGIHFRRDLITQAGLEEPQPDWTWEDVRQLAKALTSGDRKGIAMQNWVLQQLLDADGITLLTKLPDPDTSWNWRWDYTSQADMWISLIDRIRTMMHDEKSVLADISFTDDDVWGAIVKGTAAMHNTTSVHFSAPPGSEITHIALEKELGKPLEEIVGWVPEPLGVNGRTATTQGEIFLLGFDPNLEDDALDAAVGLHLYMLGDGFVRQRTAIYERTKDPRYVYDWGNITPLFKGMLEKLPSSPEEAWGELFMQRVHEASQIPLAPNEAWHFPVEENTGPSDTAYGDMTSRWFYESGDLDLRDDLGKLERTVNKQADGFTSSIAEDEFVKAARTYFTAHMDYWQEHAPEFFDNVFQPWYRAKVRPLIGG